MNHWIILFLAIVSEVVATSALKQSEEFTHLWPSVVVVIGYGIAFYLLSITLRTIPVGIVYAVWAGLGIAIIAIVGWVFLGDKLDLPAVIGIGLIISGVIVMNVFSKAVVHGG